MNRLESHPDQVLSNTQARRICQKLGLVFISHKFLAKGNHNLTWLLQTESGLYILRVENNLQFRNLHKEYGFLKTAPAGLGPQVYLIDRSHKILPADYLVEEFIEGKHPSEKHPTDSFVVQMAQWFRKLHTTRKPTKKPVTLLTWARPYLNNIRKFEKHLPKQLDRNHFRAILDKTINVLKSHDRLFVRRKYLSLLHNDTCAENIFLKDTDKKQSAPSIRLIDWEFVDFGLPERELTYFLDSYHIDARQADLFLETYYGKRRPPQLHLNLTYLILLLSSIGYSLWQIALFPETRPSTREKDDRIKRLSRDINLLKDRFK